MTEFDPERDGWQLNEAIMRLSNPEALAMIAQFGPVSTRPGGSGQFIRWWRDDLALPGNAAGPDAPGARESLGRGRSTIEQAFLARLVNGELTAWARSGSVVAIYKPVPSDAWHTLGGPDGRDMWKWDWHYGTIEVAIERRVPAPSHVFRDVLGGLSTGPSAMKVREVVERLYCVRVQPPESAQAPSPQPPQKRSAPRRFARADLDAWFHRRRAEADPALPTTAAEDWEAAKSEVSLAVTRQAIRDLRAELVPAEQRRRGARPREIAEKRHGETRRNSANKTQGWRRTKD